MCILDDRNDPTRLSINVNFNCSAFTLHPYFRCFGIRLYVVTGWWLFPYIGNVIIPTDELIFFKGVFQPPTQVINSSLPPIRNPGEMRWIAAGSQLHRQSGSRLLSHVQIGGSAAPWPNTSWENGSFDDTKNHILVCNLYIYICLSWENDGITLL